MSLPDDPFPDPPAASPFSVLWLRDLRAAADHRLTWLWHGFLAPGNLTLLTSQWKLGKTTLVSVLLSRLGTGGQLLGLSLAAGKAVVVSEESPAHWYRRGEKLAFGDHLCWICRPFRGKPTPEEWLALLDRLAELHRCHGFDLVVIDPLAAFLPGRDESNAGTMLEHLLPVQRLAGLGLSVLMLHHPGKGERAPGQAARGSGALSGCADILIEMRWYERGAEADRRRRLRAFSRYEETPRELVIELNAEGTDYLCHGPPQDEEYNQAWSLLRAVLADAPKKLTRHEILRDWPTYAKKPSEMTVWRWLDRAVAEGQVRREGSGRRADPFRYWLPGQETKWLDENPAYLLEVMARGQDEMIRERERRRRGRG